MTLISLRLSPYFPQVNILHVFYFTTLTLLFLAFFSKVIATALLDFIIAA